MAARPWGFWTESKLDMLSDYLHAFTTACKRAGTTVYLDLFAGQDENLNKHSGQRIHGSLRRAIDTKPPFTLLRGFELRIDRAASLENAYRKLAPNRDVRVYPGDVHTSLGPALKELQPLAWAPTFAFVDPQGVEARWELLEMLAAHRRQQKTKVEVFMLLASPQFFRVLHERLDDVHRAKAEWQLSQLFGNDDWRPILTDRRAGVLDPEEARDELTNLMRWRLQASLGYRYTHAVRLTNVAGGPLYDMVFATDSDAGNKIMTDVYQKTAGRFPQMRREVRARLRDRKEVEHGMEGFWPTESLVSDAPLQSSEKYYPVPPVPPYGSPDRDW